MNPGQQNLLFLITSITVLGPTYICKLKDIMSKLNFRCLILVLSSNRIRIVWFLFGEFDMAK